jgi:hypothetical protein
LEVLLADATGGEFVFLNGLVEGTRLSAGGPLGSTSRRFAARELGRDFAYAPNSFVGRPMEAGIEFRSGTNAHLDTKLGRLEWIMKSLELCSMSERQFDQGDAVEPESAAVAPASEQPNRLSKRGLEFIKDGGHCSVPARVAAGRQRASSPAARRHLRPNVLAELGVFGLTGDRATARLWYQKAMEFGSVEASRRIERLTNK